MCACTLLKNRGEALHISWQSLADVCLGWVGCGVVQAKLTETTGDGQVVEIAMAAGESAMCEPGSMCYTSDSTYPPLPPPHT